MQNLVDLSRCKIHIGFTVHVFSLPSFLASRGLVYLWKRRLSAFFRHGLNG